MTYRDRDRDRDRGRHVMFLRWYYNNGAFSLIVLNYTVTVTVTVLLYHDFSEPNAVCLSVGAAREHRLNNRKIFRRQGFAKALCT
jgi:hypothetical protein